MYFLLKINRFRFVVLWLVFCSFLYSAECATLDEFGYYKLNVAIDERTVQNLSIPNYIVHIKNGIQDLSDMLHFATNKRFSIKEAEILVPSHWELEVDDVATSQYYESADLKISHIFSLPYVNNPLPCGAAGIDVQLPYGFFNDGDQGRYGRLGKALLVLFARLRYGVWEEHGYPGDPMFPYYWKSFSNESWGINACTNSPILGNYRSIHDNSPCGPESEEDDDDPFDLYPPPSDCRFYPRETQDASTSIMSFHYLGGIERFCDATTHDREKPTPQNYYCRYKSVMEVITASADWKHVTRVNTPSRVAMKVVKSQSLPLLHILIDAGITQVPATVLSQLSSNLSDLITSRELRNIISSVKEFPADRVGDVLTEVVPWVYLRHNSSEIVSALQGSYGRKTGFKDYGGALKDVLMGIEKRNHIAGNIVLIIKTGPEAKTGDLTSESDVLSQLILGSSNTKFFAIELHANQMQKKNALEKIVRASSGHHLSISTQFDLGAPLGDFVVALRDSLQWGLSGERRHVLAMKTFMTNDATLKITAPSKILQFELSILPFLGNLFDVKLIRGEGGNYNDTILEETGWDLLEDVPQSKKSFHYSSEVFETPLESLEWGTTRACGFETCTFLVTALLQVEDRSLIAQNIKLTVTTSAQNNVVDLSVNNAGTQIGAPFAIYAKLEEDGIPIEASEGLQVNAIISMVGREEIWTVPLLDNGDTSPDVSVNDGMFSAAFLPPRNFNGVYKILVVAQYNSSHEETPDLSGTTGGASRSAGKLFPVDQAEMGCGSGFLGCWSKQPDNDFVIGTDLDYFVEFINIQSYKAVPNRIVDLVVTPLDDTVVNIQWTSPLILFWDEFDNGDEFEVKHRESFEDILDSFETGENIPTNARPSPLPAGGRHNVTFPFNRNATRYFAIKTIFFRGGSVDDPPLYSALSTIVRVNITEAPIVTTTTTTTTVRPTTVTTLPPPTTPSGQTTTEEDDLTTTTPLRTTQLRTSTVTPSIITSTLKTTPPPPITTTENSKHWFATKEGIITLSVFGGAMIFLLTATGGFFIWFTKYRQSGLRYQPFSETKPLSLSN